MSKQHKFEVGDMIKVLDGHGIKNYAGGWYPDEMNHLIGNTYKIFEIYDPWDDCKLLGQSEERIRYRIRDGKGLTWSIDARGAEKVEKNPSIFISEHISKKGRRVVQAWQDEVTACAVCHPDDPFDYFYGVRLALKRLVRAQKEKARKEFVAKKKAEIKAAMPIENNYITKGFVL